MATTPGRSNPRWPEGWRPCKRSRGNWVIDDHQILYAMRSWNAFCWINPHNRQHVAGSGSPDKQHAIDAVVEHMRTCQPWKPYERFLVNTGGNDVATLLKCKTTPFANLPLAIIEACASGQVELLRRLDAAGLLRYPPPRKSHTTTR